MERLREAVKREIEREVTAQEASETRLRVLRRALGWTALYAAGFGINFLMEAEHPSTSWWFLAALWLVALPIGAWRLTKQYRSIAPRAATIVDEERLQAEVDRSTLCPHCTTPIPRSADPCPHCGAILRPLLAAAVVGGFLLLIFASIALKAQWFR